MFPESRGIPYVNTWRGLCSEYLMVRFIHFLWSLPPQFSFELLLLGNGRRHLEKWHAREKEGKLLWGWIIWLASTLEAIKWPQFAKNKIPDRVIVRREGQKTKSSINFTSSVAGFWASNEHQNISLHNFLWAHSDGTAVCPAQFVILEEG